MPSLISEAAQGAARRVHPPGGVDVVVHAPGAAEATSLAPLEQHTDALTALFRFCAELVPALHVVLLVGPGPSGRLHVRGPGMPSMIIPVPPAQRAALQAVEHVIRRMGARLFFDLGGFLVLYGAFGEDEP